MKGASGAAWDRGSRIEDRLALGDRLADGLKETRKHMRRPQIALLSLEEVDMIGSSGKSANESRPSRLFSRAATSSAA